MRAKDLENRLHVGGSVKAYRADGYTNLLNKYGTKRDNGEAYFYAEEGMVNDQTYTANYETNGLFAKIIDIPAQEAVKTGFTLGIEDTETEDYIQGELKRLGFMKACEKALKWSRLYGGALGVMIIDDGAEKLSDPVDWSKAKGIEEILVYSRDCVWPDETTLYQTGVTNGRKISQFMNPEYYRVSSIYGSFVVHESRCLIFRNGDMPERAMNEVYRFWGVPEYNRIRRALRETETAHGDAVKLLERMVQPIYKMNGLADLLATEGGDDVVFKRLDLVDTSRGILNTIAIDSDNEDYEFKSISLTGVADVVDNSCAMLSALTEIPQTKLFGRSPSGMNATGESDLENYYSFIDKIRQLQIRDNLEYIVDGVIQIALNTGRLTERPTYEVEFEPLWNESETEKAQTEYQRAQTEYQRAQTTQLYIDMGILDPSEARKELAREGAYGIEETEEEGESVDDAFRRIYEKYRDMGSLTDTEGADEATDTATEETPETEEKAGEHVESIHGDSDDDDLTADNPTDVRTVAVIVVDGEGRLLCGKRSDDGTYAGGGGHIHEGESTLDAAKREMREEFGIEVSDLRCIGYDTATPEGYERPLVYVTDTYSNAVLPDTKESKGNAFRYIYDIRDNAYPPFMSSLELLRNAAGLDDIKAKVIL